RLHGLLLETAIGPRRFARNRAGLAGRAEIAGARRLTLRAPLDRRPATATGHARAPIDAVERRRPVGGGAPGPRAEVPFHLRGRGARASRSSVASSRSVTRANGDTPQRNKTSDL